MKKILLLVIIALSTQTIKAQAVVLDTNGVTIKYTGTTAPSPRWVQASPRGVMEWFAIVDNNIKGSIINYAKNVPSSIISFTPPGGSSPIPFNNIVTTLVTDMSSMFYNASSFNQDIGSWDVGNVTNMNNMFSRATAFNQPLEYWNVSNVTDLSEMFYNASSFNQDIGSWDVSKVTNMSVMFLQAYAFNQPLGSWNVSNVTNMAAMFWDATAFNQPIGSWDVSKVNNMYSMFRVERGDTNAFNQPIGSWNVSNVTNMSHMFHNASTFNQNIGSWDVGNVTDMGSMFGNNGLSTTNYDATLIGWSTITSLETPLKPNVNFYGGYSTYCNGASARNLLISTYGWTISDSGIDFDCASLGTEDFDKSSVSLYPNPVLSVLNIDNNLTNQPYNIIDTLGKVILKGKLNEGNNSFNVEQLSKGIYYLKVSDKNASKFIKE